VKNKTKKSTKNRKKTKKKAKRAWKDLIFFSFYIKIMCGKWENSPN
jgi:hypothetical protein